MESDAQLKFYFQLTTPAVHDARVVRAYDWNAHAFAGSWQQFDHMFEYHV